MINLGFWKKLKKPIMVLAPMADVTDATFRKIIAKYGKPDVFWTEFVSADGLMSIGREKILHNLWFSKAEQPIVAQIFSSNPEAMRGAASLVADLGFKGIDINMGCPEKNICKGGAGAAMVKDYKRAQEVILAAKEGSEDLPVSVKIRTGWNTHELETWLPNLLEAEPAVITVHARNRQEMSKVPANWDLVKQAVQLRDELQKNNTNKTLIIGNGDLTDLADAREKIKFSGADGAMLGRAIFGNPWLFSEHKPSVEEKLRVMLEHTRLFEKMFKGIKNFDVMKKHFKAYVEGFPGAKEIRIDLMTSSSASEVEEKLKKHFPKYFK